MALLGNVGYYARGPVRNFGILTPGTEAANFRQSGRLLNFRLHEDAATAALTSGYPSGYRPPYSHSMASKSGGLKSFLESQGIATVTGSMAGGRDKAETSGGLGTGSGKRGLVGSGGGTAAGRNIAATSEGLATVTGTGSLVVSGAGTASGVATVTGNVNAALGAVGTTSGSATATGSIKALAWAVGQSGGAGGVSAVIFATGQLQGSITPYTELSPQSLAAEVWNATASSYTESGTMGFKVNSAASAGDPWSTSLPGSYAPGTAGYILGSDLQPDNIATRLLDIADAIEQELTVRKALRLVSASLAGKMSGLDGSTVTIRSAYADDKARIVASVDEFGNRSALTYDLSD